MKYKIYCLTTGKFSSGEYGRGEIIKYATYSYLILKTAVIKSPLFKEITSAK